MGFVKVLSFWPVLLRGLQTTLALSAVAIGAGSVVGLVVGVLLTARAPWVRATFRTYVSLFRGTPLLVQLFLIYLGPGSFGLAIGIFEAAAIGFTLYSGAYIAEIVRSGIQAVPTGQFEAAQSLGLHYVQVMARVIVPQTRTMITPALASFYLGVIKDTSLASIVGLADLISQSKIVIAATEKPFQTYAVVAAAYFIFCFPLSRVVARLERKSGAT